VATGIGLFSIQDCKFLTTVATISFQWTLLQLYLRLSCKSITSSKPSYPQKAI